MKKTILFGFIFVMSVCNAQVTPAIPAGLPQVSEFARNHSYDLFFQNAYSQFPQVPKGTLEAVAYTMTRIHHIDSITTPESCTGMPRVFGVMGLTLDGKNYFRNNLIGISQLSGFPVHDIISSPEINILAFAKAYSVTLLNSGISGNDIEDQIPVLIALSELPDNDIHTNFALNSHLYAVLSFLNNPEFQSEYMFPGYTIDFEKVFGKENLKVLSAPHVIVKENSIHDKGGNPFLKKNTGNIPVIFSPDYAPALWNAAASCNYSSRAGTAISAITIHDVEGSYAGCISWFKNCAASVSAHYVLRSSDGQITQMVLESNKAWHVGSENPYTIGFEHEGYRNQTGWYTVAMYTASGDLARDICNSGYGINPIRTGFQPWMGPTEYNASGIPGSCVRIKGHQHYPNQTHNDPGPNWNWSYYFNKINNNPGVTSLSSATGTFYDTGGSTGNYSDDENSIWTINPSGVSSVTVTFSSFNLENTWDYLYIYDGADIWAPVIGYYTGTTSPGTVTSSGGSITFQFRSDCATTAAGWNASWTSSGNATVPTNLSATVSPCPNNTATLSWTNSGTGWYIDISTDPAFGSFFNKNVDGLTTTSCPTGFCDYPGCSQPLSLQPNTTYYWRIWNGSSHTSGQSFTTNNCDNTPPTTTASVTGNWQTQDFTTTFSDADNVGVAKRFFQVLDWNGTEWRANFNHGFFNDNFDIALNAEWTGAAGTWAIASSYLNQADDLNGNTNIYASLNQNASYTYLYHFQMRMGGAGTNRRAGLHFFSDNSTLPNRGNGYFVYFRADNQKAQIYKVVNDAFTLESDIPYAFAVNTFYDFKTTFDPSSGVIRVFVNDVFVSSWTDVAPITSGNSISARTGNCTADYNDLKVYRSRSTSETVSIGNSSAQVRYQNPNPSTPSCRIKSLVTDGADNWSVPATLNVNVDWTPPSDVALSDGSSADIDTCYITTELTANWTASADPHSSIASYRYAIGTSQGATDIAGWTNNGSANSVTHTGLSLVYNTMYYFSVKAEDGAGLFSNEIYSDGQYLTQPLPPPSASFSTANSTICPGETINFQNTSTDANSFAWTFQNGNPATSTSSNPLVAYTASGTYSVILIAYGPGGTSDTITQNVSVTVNAAPNAAFNANPTTVFLPSAAVNFTSNSTSTTSLNWLFGDGNSSTAQNPSHSYADTGFYSVTLIAGNGLCDNDTLIMQDYIYVGPDPSLTAPVASFFTSGFGYACEGDSVSFINNSTDATSYQWTFAGGSPSTSTAANQAALFTASGNYNVTLIAVGPGGSDTLQQSVSINVVLLPAADFSGSDSVVYQPYATVDFTNLSDNATNFTWDFGDGGTSTASDPTYTYSDTGFYTVTLIAGNDNCPDDTIVYTNYIYVGSDTSTVYPPPVAGFSTSSTTYCQGNTVSFTNTSANAVSYLWTFNGGNPSTSTASNPSSTFSSSGTFNVSLIATGPGGSDTVIQSFIVVSPPNANFSASPATAFLPNATVNFTNTSTNSTSYYWEFGDGTSSTIQNPSHTYNDTGYYSIILVAMNSTCPADTLILSNYIFVDDTATIAPPPVADFSFSSANICAGGFIDFTNTSTDALTFVWSFIGGTPSSSTVANPSVSFPASGNYNVTLVATGPGGSDTLSQAINVTIAQPPSAGFSATSTNVNLPPGIAYFNNSSSGATSFFWDFGDGTTSTDVSPWHAYSDTGYFSVMLVASNGICPDDTLTMTGYIHVSEPVGTEYRLSSANSTFSVYPNPGSGLFTIAGSGLNPSEAEIFNILGEVILRKSYPANKYSGFFDLSEYGKGIYFLSITSGNENQKVKLIVQ